MIKGIGTEAVFRWDVGLRFLRTEMTACFCHVGNCTVERELDDFYFSQQLRVMTA